MARLPATSDTRSDMDQFSAERRLVEMEIEFRRANLERRNPALALTRMDEEKKSDDPAVHYLYGAINNWGWGYGADLTALRDFLDDNAKAGGGDVLLRINSYGGTASAGVAMMNLIRDYPGKVTAQVDGVCMSAATLPFLAAESRLVGTATEFMIHNPSLLAWGDGKELAKSAAYLDKLADMYAEVYADLSDLDKAGAAEAMDEETYYTPAEAIDAGFATGMAKPAPVESDGDDDDDDDDDPDIVVVVPESDGEKGVTNPPEGDSVAVARIAAEAKKLREIELSRIRRLYTGV